MGDESTLGWLIPCFWIGLALSALMYPLLWSAFGAHQTGLYAFLAGGALCCGALVYSMRPNIAINIHRCTDSIAAVAGFLGLFLIAEAAIFTYVTRPKNHDLRTPCVGCAAKLIIREIFLETMGSTLPLVKLLYGNQCLYDEVVLNLSDRDQNDFVNWWTVGVKLSLLQNPKLRKTIDNTWLVHVTRAGAGDNQRAVYFLERIIYEIGGVTCGEFAQALHLAGLPSLSLLVTEAADQLAQPKRKLLVDVFYDHKDLRDLLVTNIGYGPTLAQFWSQLAVRLMTIPRLKGIITDRWIRRIVNQNDAAKLRSEHFLKLITSDPINISVSEIVTALRLEGFYSIASAVEIGAVQQQQLAASKAAPPLDDAYIEQLVQQRVSKILADLPPAAVVVAAAAPAPALPPPAAAPVSNDRNLECAVCLDQPRTMLLKPCNHFAVCASCAGRINNICPLCRDKVLSMEKVFFA